jgi:purine-cytosine permease-like protein
VAWCAIVGLGVPLLAFAIAGAILELSTGTWNLVDVLEQLGSPTVAYAFVALGFTGSVLTNLHSGALSFEDAVSNLTHRRALLVVAVTGTALAALDFADSMIGFLTAMALAAPCLIGVLWIDELRNHRPARYVPVAIVAWAAGIVVGVVLRLLDSPIALPAGIAAAAAVAAIPLFRGHDRSFDHST